MPAAYTTATSGSGGSCSSQLLFTVTMSSVRSRRNISAADPARIANPHHEASVSHPSLRHALMISAKLTNGTINPIDFKSSVRQIPSSSATDPYTVRSPAAAQQQASATAKRGSRSRLKV
jgi:hypothetical protein